MRTWLERARSSVRKRAIKRGSSDLPTLEDLEEYGDYLRGLLAEDPSLGRRKLREAIKEKGFLVSPTTMSNWLDRYHGKSKRTLLAAPIDGLPCLDLEGLRAYDTELLSRWADEWDITYTRLKEFLEQEHGRTCSKETMQHWMQRPRPGVVLSADVLCGRGKRIRSNSWPYGYRPDRLGDYIRVLTSLDGGAAKLWHKGSNCTETLGGHSEEGGHTANLSFSTFSPDDGWYILTASYDSIAKIWCAMTCHCRRTLRGHTDIVFSALFSMNMYCVVTASRDRTAKI